MSWVALFSVENGDGLRFVMLYRMAISNDFDPVYAVKKDTLSHEL